MMAETQRITEITVGRAQQKSLNMFSTEQVLQFERQALMDSSL
jgi:hypothetical protein